MRHWSRSVWLVIVVACSLALAPAVRADLEDDIETAVILGLGWLAEEQDSSGAWDLSSCDPVGATGLAVLKFEDRALDLGYDPLDPEYEYSEVVTLGLNYIESMKQTTAPVGVFWMSTCWNHEVYTTGIVMMALAASQHPELYGLLLQDALDWMSYAQADPDCGVHRGGWRYWPDLCDSDNSISGYATLGLGFAAAAPPFGFGLSIPDVVKDELDIWIDVIQDDMNGDADDGGSHYTPFGGWVNILKTGNLIYEMGLVGDDATITRVEDAVNYIERHWYDAGGCGTGWVDHRQAMFTMMKGLESLGIQYLYVGGESPVEIDWFVEVATHLIATQNGDGSWPGDCWGGQVLSTAWALLTLEKAVPAFEIQVAVDIKPTSCRNPFNVGKKGVMPVAILGTEDFDVTQIDPVTVMLAGVVSPLRWALEDVATPFEPYLGATSWSCRSPAT